MAYAGAPRGGYKDSVGELGLLVVDVCAAKRARNYAALDKLFNGLILPNHEAWMVATFGEAMGRRIAATYSRERDHVPELFSSAFTAIIEEGTTRAEIQAIDEPDVQLVGYYGTPSINLRMQRPVRLYEVRFVSTVQKPKGRRQFIFAHVDGNFRYLGTLEPAPAAPAETLADTAPFTEMPLGGVVGGVPGGIPGGVVGGVIGRNATIPREMPSASESPTPKARLQTIRVAGSVMQAKLLRRVEPVYPQIARLAHASGVVILEVTVDRNGSIQSTRSLSGHPLLIHSAVQAVNQWKYEPTMLNGEPVYVVTTVTVAFRLDTKPPE